MLVRGHGVCFGCDLSELRVGMLRYSDLRFGSYGLLWRRANCVLYFCSTWDVLQYSMWVSRSLCISSVFWNPASFPFVALNKHYFTVFANYTCSGSRLNDL